jgi:hypothetical protein
MILLALRINTGQDDMRSDGKYRVGERRDGALARGHLSWQLPFSTEKWAHLRAGLIVSPRIFPIYMSVPFF